MSKTLGVKVRGMVMSMSEWGKLVCHNFLWTNYKLVFYLFHTLNMKIEKPKNNNNKLNMIGLERIWSQSKKWIFRSLVN